MTSCRFPDAMGDVVEEGDIGDQAAALAWARDGNHDEDVQRVEHIGPQREGAGLVRCSTDIEGTLRAVEMRMLTRVQLAGSERGLLER